MFGGRGRCWSSYAEKAIRGREEESLQQWGIALDSKRRRKQLANRLWSNPDMNHVVESAAVVARLVRFTGQGKALKEMFGLSFSPHRMLYSWRNPGRLCFRPRSCTPIYLLYNSLLTLMETEQLLFSFCVTLPLNMLLPNACEFLALKELPLIVDSFNHSP
ncbi:Kinesin protein NACK1 [Spatholobus suberectus]|nr:Kinesin protein NACK1 [Spatholobus suberectus]